MEYQNNEYSRYINEQSLNYLRLLLGCVCMSWLDKREILKEMEEIENETEMESI